MFDFRSLARSNQTFKTGIRCIPASYAVPENQCEGSGEIKARDDVDQLSKRRPKVKRVRPFNWFHKAEMFHLIVIKFINLGLLFAF